MALLEAPENTQFHVTFLALQLPVNFIIMQTMFHCHCMMKGSYDIGTHYELNRKLNELCISATMKVFGCDHRKGSILSQLQWKGLALMYETMFSPVS
jgi:hypothetical protein